ncbi:MAG: acylglycerol kinase family protein, partial [candidate division KSB1 bacterium]|nr:acylglycerol kinase family protein [candidate division KSB1 bacterium]
KVILNPYAGRWKALQRKDDIKASLRNAGIEYELVVTERPGHGIQLAKEAVQHGFAPIISAGGDGSINEVINGERKPKCLNRRIAEFLILNAANQMGRSCNWER